MERLRAWRPAALQAVKLILGVLVLEAISRALKVDPLWAQISLIVVAMEPTGTWQAAWTRTLNTLIGSVAGLLALLTLGPNLPSMCLALAVVVFVCTARLGSPTRWKIAPITTLIVMGPAIRAQSRSIGIESGARRVGEVIAGSFFAVLLSLVLSRVEPAE